MQKWDMMRGQPLRERQQSVQTVSKAGLLGGTRSKSMLGMRRISLFCFIPMEPDFRVLPKTDTQQQKGTTECQYNQTA